MLTQPVPEHRRASHPLSLRQEYGEFIEQRIEDFKNQLSRGELLAIADDAVRELDAGPEGQLLLTEVLVLEHVDRLIMRRLKLPTFRRWRQRHIRLRRAQRAPTHWGVPTDGPLVDLAPLLEPADHVLVIGSGAAPYAFFLAAHDTSVLVIDETLQGIEAVETRATTEALGHRVQAMVVTLGRWFPDVTPTVVVFDAGRLTDLDPALRVPLIETAKARTAQGGWHLIPPVERRVDIHALAPEALQSSYRGWVLPVVSGDRLGRWFQARKPTVNP
ncbi:MAG TPA: hypothetical protein VGA37_01260 [Gemmatimonadales bacterium]